jgi:hypothetical protein
MRPHESRFLSPQMGKAVRVLNLPKGTHKLFRRALAIAGAGSQSKWLLTQIRQFVRQQQQKFGEDLFQVLTAEEKDLLEIIASVAAEIQHIAEESMLPEKQVAKIIADLVDRGLVEERAKGGKTDQARGAKIKLYFVKEK